MFEGIPEARPKIANFIKNTHNFDPHNQIALNGDYNLTIQANSSFAFENKDNLLKVSLRPQEPLRFSADLLQH